MLITVITICKNCVNNIEKTIKSVVIQKYDNYEYWVIDGNSNDGTIEKIKPYEKSLNFISEKDDGISDAFNKGIDRATGEYLIFLNGGDVFTNDGVLQRVSDTLKNSKADIVTFNEITNKGDIWLKNDNDALYQWRMSLIPHQSTFISKKIFEQIGKYNISYKVRMDYEFFKKCYYFGCSFEYSLEPIVIYDLDGISAKDTVSFEKEGLSIRLLYDSKFSYNDIDLLSSIVEVYEQKIPSMCEVENIPRLIREQKSNLYRKYLEKYIRKMQLGEIISDVIREDDIYSVAVYGWGGLGQIIYNEFRLNEVNVPAVVDKRAKSAYIKIYDFDDDWPLFDAICITVLGDVNSIIDMLSKKGNWKIYNLCAFLDS